jgi:exosortase
LVGAVILLCALPIRLIEEANPEWRLILWLHAGWAVALSLLLLGYTGGHGWMRHFAFVVAFPLISVPLPTGVEQDVIQRLTRVVTLVTAELANLSGIPAFPRGNLIEISAGVLGIEEACSGIRSLQSSLLVALFLGEFHRFSIARRVVLVALGCGVAVWSNVGRTYILVRVAASEGLAASHEGHDTIAAIALVATLGLLFLIAHWLRPKSPPAATNTGRPSGESNAHRTSAPRTVPSWISAAALGWLVMVGAGVQLWYWSHERGAVPNAGWSIREPAPADGFKPIEIAERSRAILRYSSGHCMTWRDSSAFQWRLYYLRWEAGRNSAQLAKAHTPEICLSGAGGQLKERVGKVTVSLPSFLLSFDQYVFDFSGQQLHVFYCLWEDERIVPRTALPEDYTRQSRLAAVFAGRRHLGQTVIEAAVRGPDSAEEARVRFTKELQRMIIVR